MSSKVELAWVHAVRRDEQGKRRLLAHGMPPHQGTRSLLGWVILVMIGIPEVVVVVLSFDLHDGHPTFLSCTGNALGRGVARRKQDFVDGYDPVERMCCDNMAKAFSVGLLIFVDTVCYGHVEVVKRGFKVSVEL
eukprot:scaffold1347_cov350-Pavlova_lutheri.AAC.3